MSKFLPAIIMAVLAFGFGLLCARYSDTPYVVVYATAAILLTTAAIFTAMITALDV